MKIKCCSGGFIELCALPSVRPRPGGAELLGPALPAAPPQQRQGVHPQGGLLDHLEHHGRKPSTDTGEAHDDCS